MGSYNAIESNIDESNKSITFVYDFATSQANGRISAISLTSLRAGKCMPFGIKHGGESSFADQVSKQWEHIRSVIARKPYKSLIGSSSKPFLVSFANDCVYTWGLSDATTLVIGKSRLCFSSIGMFGTQYGGKVEEIATIPLDGLSDPNTYGYNYDRHTDKLYIMCTNNVSPNSVAKYIEYDVTHQTGVVKTFTNQFYRTLDMGNTYVNKGKLYVHVGGGNWGTINLSNTSDIRLLDDYMQGSKRGAARQPFAMGDYVYCEWGAPIDWRFRLYVMDDTHISRAAGLTIEGTDSVYYPSEEEQRYIPCVESDLLFAAVIVPDGTNPRENYYRAMCMYLATINNLETPVVKTSDKTMKITYTLTETE
jgi:hypothetical protein